MRKSNLFSEMIQQLRIYAKLRTSVALSGWAVGTPLGKGVLLMITFEAMNMLFQFGIFLATTLSVVVAIVVAIVITNKKK